MAKITPAFIRGFSKVFDLGASLADYTVPHDGGQKDCDALRKDWEAVGGYISEAMGATPERRPLSG